MPTGEPVQFVSSTTSPPSIGINGNAFKFTLPNPVLAGNALLLRLFYKRSVSRTVAVTDTINGTWGGGTLVGAVDSSGLDYTSAVYVFPNAGTGVTTVTVTFDTSLLPFRYGLYEVPGIATASPVGTSSTGQSTAPTCSPAALTTPNNDANGGHVIFTFADDVSVSSGHSVTSFTAGGSGTLLDADITWATTASLHHASQYEVQTTHGTITPSITATMGTNDSFLVFSVALKLSPGAGQARPAGIRIVAIHHFTIEAPSGTIKTQVPCIGNLVHASLSTGLTNCPITSVTDSDSGSWTTIDPSGGDVPVVWYSKNRSASSTRIISYVVTGTPAGQTWNVFDIAGADTTSPLTATAFTISTSASNLTSIAGFPNIVPQGIKGLTIARCALGQGPCTGLDTGSPTGAIFDFVNYTGETDQDTLDNADCLAHVYNDNTVPVPGIFRDGPGLQTWNWVITSINGNTSGALGVHYKEASASAVGPFPGLTAITDTAGATRTLGPYTTTRGGLRLTLIVNWRSNNGIAVYPTTTVWHGGTPTGATAWVLARSDRTTGTGADNLGVEIWTCTTTQALSAVSIDVTAFGGTDTGNSAVFTVDAFANVSGIGATGGQASVSGSSISRNVTLPGVKPGSKILIGYDGDINAVTAVANTVTLGQATSPSGDTSAAGTNETGLGGSVNVGWTGTQTTAALSAIELQEITVDATLDAVIQAIDQTVVASLDLIIGNHYSSKGSINSEYIDQVQVDGAIGGGSTQVLAGTVTAVSAFSAALLKVARAISGSVAAQSALNALLGLKRPIAGNIAAVSTLSSTLTRLLALQGSVAAVSNIVSAAMKVLRGLSGSAAAVSNVNTALLKVQYALAGVTAALSAIGPSMLAVKRPLSGSVTAASTIGPDLLGLLRPLSITIPGQSAFAAGLTVTAGGTAQALAGAIAALSALTGSLRLSLPLSGPVTAASTLHANLGARMAFASTVAAISTVNNALLAAQKPIASTVAAHSTINGAAGIRMGLVGLVTAQSAISEIIKVLRGLTGVIHGQSNVQASMLMHYALAGLSSAHSSLQGSMGGLIHLTGLMTNQSSLVATIGVGNLSPALFDVDGMPAIPMMSGVGVPLHSIRSVRGLLANSPLILNTSAEGRISAYTRGSDGLLDDDDGFIYTFHNDISRHRTVGVLLEHAATNLMLHSRDLTTGWTASNMSVALGSTGKDNILGDANILTALGSNATLLQAVTLGSSSRTFSAFVKRSLGGGNVAITTDGGSTWKDITGPLAGAGGAWIRVSVSQTLANPNVGFRLSTTNDVILVDFCQLEAGGYATSPLVTVAGTSSRSVDSLTMPTQGFPTRQGGVEFSYTPEWDASAQSGSVALFDAVTGAPENGLKIEGNSSGVKATVWVGGVSTVLNAPLAWVAGTTYRVRVGWIGGVVQVFVNGASLAQDVWIGPNTWPAQATMTAIDGFMKRLLITLS